MRRFKVSGCLTIKRKRSCLRLIWQVADFCGVDLLTLSDLARERALKLLDQEDRDLSKSVMLRCRVRYFTDDAILGSAEFVRGFTGARQIEYGRKHPPKVNTMRGAKWGDLAVIQGLKNQVFG